MASINLSAYEDEDENEFEDDEYENELHQDQVGNLSDEEGDHHHNMEESDMASLPTELKALRACMVCTLVKTYGQFIDEGCDNCESFLKMADRQDRVAEFTSHAFEG
jgi:ABC-type Zn2+ transport system substrate-binding protein/surface adhesin